ncbi:hypothetical protein SAMN02910298_01940 [Pseudobutyrivibrio sp. YE44]|uniref:hypothetical protein n=1 Tax=Pseudobutyrivibrio sp. YE44 TaxID=1520802 RepID=UPI000886116B|nr:hypothetical protein [Pseudobutyrivibrio sp. YE44]SDB39853.1 hypothetical protein SAMN02910298_01940 [Pseudobutyrivibrio sp. YE44]
MTYNDILDQEMLKKQCKAAVETLANRNEHLAEIGNVFAAALMMEDTGKSADAIRNQCNAYLAIIKGMIYANELDSIDHAALGSMLSGGGVQSYLYGHTILTQIAYEKSEEMRCASAAADCRNKAYECDNSLLAQKWYDAADNYDAQAANHRAAWDKWCAKRDFFDNVEETTKGYFQNSKPYRALINQGMLDIAFSFSNGTYNIPANSKWQQGIEKLNEEFDKDIENTAKSLLNTDEEIDQEKVNELLSKKVTELTPSEYELYKRLKGLDRNQMEEEIQRLAKIKEKYQGNDVADLAVDVVGNFGIVGSFVNSAYKIGDGIAKDKSTTVGKGLFEMGKNATDSFGRLVENAYTGKPGNMGAVFGDFRKGGAVADLLDDAAVASKPTKWTIFKKSIGEELDYLPKLAGENATVAKNLKVATKWGGAAFSLGANAMDNIQEMHDNPGMTKGRAVAETVTETAVDIVIGAAATAAFTALMGASAPAIAVGAAVVGVTWLANLGVEKATAAVWGEENKRGLTELASDGLLYLATGEF